MNHKTPSLAVDIVLCRAFPDPDGDVQVVVIERKFAPLGFALPGGFVEIGETVEEAAIREAKEETGIDIELVGMIGVFSDPARDPRQHVVSVAFLACPKKGSPPLLAGDDAKDASWRFALEATPWCFDHSKILAKALASSDLLAKWEIAVGDNA